MNPSNRFRNDFESFGRKIWLNAASEGPLPKQSAQDLRKAIMWKSRPYDLTNEKFVRVPRQLKESIGLLLQVNPRDVILANSASYGVHLLANGIQWRRGDEVCLMQNDFPTNILPWLALSKKGVRIKQIKPARIMMTPADLEQHISPKTKLLCISHVHTFSGYMADLEGFANICRRHKIIFVLNISQSVGTMPLDFSHLKVDALVAAGYKWLCGPYGSGFCWIRPELRDQLDLNLGYWIPSLDATELQSEDALRYKELHGARKYDVFGTANFFNFVPFNSSIQYILKVGLSEIWRHNQSLIAQLIDGLPSSLDLLSPKEPAARSNLVFISHRNKSKNKSLHAGLTADGIYTGFWKGNIRICPHIYNSTSEMTRLLAVLKSKV